MIVVLLILTVIFLSYANGANDNFKGVITLFGSRATSYRKALYWATVATFLGSLSSIWLAHRLMETFSGKGLVTDSLVGSPDFLLAVGLGAAVTVFLATRIGFPISTTHSLMGSLLGAALIADPSGVNAGVLGGVFFAPLLLSPVAALVFTTLLYPAFRSAQRRWGVTKDSSLCLDQEVVKIPPDPSNASVLAATANLTLLGQRVQRIERYQGHVLDAPKALEAAHFFSSGLVSFARGLNDTPKIVAVFAVATAGNPRLGFWLVGTAMACGGLWSARKVAMTMSRRITPMNHGQGFTASFVTAVLVIFLSRLGLPASTTHVSCGSLFGIGLITREGKWRTIRNILTAWIITLPVASLMGALIFWFQAAV